MDLELNVWNNWIKLRVVKVIVNVLVWVNEVVVWIGYVKVN